jgi:hypothetical protein
MSIETINWNLQGQTVTGRYVSTFLVTGTVINSYVLLGGRVKHSVQLNEPTEILGSIREIVVLSHEEIV